MEVTATLRYARITPRKMRLVGDLCKGLPVEKAHQQLDFCQKKGGKLLAVLLDSAIANAKEKGGAALLTYHHFEVKLPYYEKAAKGELNFDEAKTEYKDLLEKLYLNNIN